MQLAAGAALSAFGARKSIHVHRERFGEIGKFLPVALVWLIIAFIYIEYVFLHCARLLQFDVPETLWNHEEIHDGVHHMLTFHTLTALVLYCLIACILTEPGTIPLGPTWDLRAEEAEGSGDPLATPTQGSCAVETKTSGERRICKWCYRYKPDRCHHCRQCNACVLRMDHHCPYVYNCIGFRNHKYFFLLLVYSVATLVFVGATMLDTLLWSTRYEVPLFTVMALAIGELGVLVLGAGMGAFLVFHCYLVLNGLTTLEFWEKTGPRSGTSSVNYSRGCYLNICAVLGDYPPLWFLPVAMPSGDGVFFERRMQYANRSFPAAQTALRAPLV